MTGVRIFASGEGESIDFRGASIVRKVRAEETDHRWAFGEGRNEPGFLNTPHTHDEPEGFFVLEGSYTFFTEAEDREVGSGSFVFIPPGTRHGFVAGADGGRLLCLWPARFDGYFWEMGDALVAGEPDPEGLNEIARRHGMQNLR